MPDAYETRTVTTPLEFREDTGHAPVLEGYASTFMQPYDLGTFREQIAPGAFTRSIVNGADVRLLIDHMGQPLARTKSGTLTLNDKDLAGNALPGLRVRAELDPSDPDVQRLLPKMRRGDLDQMSFAFRVPKGGDSWSEDYTLRTITEANLAGGDVSVVTYPANDQTSVSVRAADLREARCTFLDAMVGEFRAGRAISEANMTKLQDVLASLADVDSSLDAADAGLDAALATMADVMGVTNPDPPDTDDVQANSLPLSLALALAQREGIRRS